MPFLRRWDNLEQDYVIDRDLTGPPKPSPNTGTAQAQDGTIVGDASNVNIPPATPIPVTIPSPYEPVLDSRGSMNPRWWRFLEELYRRTGAIEDNINNVDRLLGGSTTAGSMAFAGVAPSIIVGQTVPSASLTFTGNVPTVV
jgi:hypothetical protein